MCVCLYRSLQYHFHIQTPKVHICMQSLSFSHSLYSLTHSKDALLSIGSAMTAMEFQDAVKAGLHLAFLNVKQLLVMLLDVGSNELAYHESNTCFQTLVKDGVVW